ncbi:hypothetical protein [Clostridium sp.]|uniref:tetratricopeptide repeat protein n=1 Tax=Clostridium sp. TaxID=1506 RepID=UPI0026265514|nr:hypothetical protein [Clostridium sp.]
MLEKLSNIYMEEGLKNLYEIKLTTAQFNFKKAVNINDNNWKAKNLQGLCLYTTGEFDRALSLWGKSIKINSEQNNRAYFYIASMKDQKFLTFCELYNKALKYAQDGSFKKIEKLLKDSDFDSCKIISFMNFKGLCMLKAGKKDEAIAIWKKVLLIDKENEAAKKYIINSLDKKYDDNFIYSILRRILKK